MGQIFVSFSEYLNFTGKTSNFKQLVNHLELISPCRRKLLVTRIWDHGKKSFIEFSLKSIWYIVFSIMINKISRK